MAGREFSRQGKVISKGPEAAENSVTEKNGERPAELELGTPGGRGCLALSRSLAQRST